MSDWVRSYQCDGVPRQLDDAYVRCEPVDGFDGRVQAVRLGGRVRLRTGLQQAAGWHVQDELLVDASVQPHGGCVRDVPRGNLPPERVRVRDERDDAANDEHDVPDVCDMGRFVVVVRLLAWLRQGCDRWLCAEVRRHDGVRPRDGCVLGLPAGLVPR
jgi:hypothetical protein